nr:hypothetical protein CFP56_17015 [Quercus suber]
MPSHATWPETLRQTKHEHGAVEQSEGLNTTSDKPAMWLGKSIHQAARVTLLRVPYVGLTPEMSAMDSAIEPRRLRPGDKADWQRRTFYADHLQASTCQVEFHTTRANLPSSCTSSDVDSRLLILETASGSCHLIQKYLIADHQELRCHEAETLSMTVVVFHLQMWSLTAGTCRHDSGFHRAYLHDSCSTFGEEKIGSPRYGVNSGVNGGAAAL